jgi:copper chaperone CopZ
VTDSAQIDENGPKTPLRAGSQILAAMCWWSALFLILAALTIESVMATPERLRMIAVVAAGGLLVAGFFLIYRKRPMPQGFGGLRRFNAVMVWLVTAGLAAFALIPRDGSRAQVDHQPEITTVAKGVDATQLAKATKHTYAVRGMVCQSCVETVTEALLAVPGVLAADVKLESGRAVVSLAPDAVLPDTSLVNAVVRAGYELWPTSDGDSGVKDQVEEIYD